MLSVPRALAVRTISLAALTLAAASALEANEPDAEQELLDQITATLSRNGPYAASLVDPLRRLGSLYHEGDDYVLALATLERAVQVLRANEGLHSLEQVPLVRQLIRVEEMRGNHAGAWAREQELLTLLRRHPDDLRTVPVLKAIADKQMEVLRAVMNGEKRPEIELGCFYQQWPTGAGSCYAGSRKTVVQGMFAEAQRNYSDAIGILLRNGLFDSEELHGLEMAVLRGIDSLHSRYGGPSAGPFALLPAFVGARSIEPWRSRIAPVAALAQWDLPYPVDWLPAARAIRHAVKTHLQLMDPYERGRQSLLRLAAYAAASDASPLDQADAVVQVADWDLLYSHNGQAMDVYDSARALLAAAAVPNVSVDELFAPSMPVVLPAFRPNPFVVEETRPATGHIDIAFEITKYGRGREVVIVDAVNASADTAERLVKLVAGNRFRPRLTDGRFADVTPVVIRYYVYD